MLVSDLIKILQRESSETQDDTGYNNLVLSWVQDAITEFGNLTDWKYFQSVIPITTVIGTRVYSLPVEHRDIRALLFPVGRLGSIDYMDLWRLKERSIDILESGVPRFWYFEDVINDPAPTNNKLLRIGLWPVPNSVIVLSAHTQLDPSQLLLTDILPVQNNILPAIKHKVRFYSAMDDNDSDRAIIHAQNFENEINRLRAKEHTVRDNLRVLSVTDIPVRRPRLVQLDPDHFRN